MEGVLEYRDGIEWIDPENQPSMLSMFQIDLDNYMQVKFGLMYHMQIPPEQIENWPYWEYEMHVERLADVLKKKQQGEKNQAGEMTNSQINPQKAAADMMKKGQANLPKMPSFRMPR